MSKKSAPNVVTLAGIDGLELSTSIQLDPDIVEGIKRAKAKAKDATDRIGYVQIGGDRWAVHPTAAGRWWHLHAERDGRHLLLRDLGAPQARFHDDDDDAPPDPLPRVEFQADPNDWQELTTQTASQRPKRNTINRWAVKGEWDSWVLWRLVAGDPTPKAGPHPQLWAAASEFRATLNAIAFNRAGAGITTDTIRVSRLDLCADAILNHGFALADMSHWRGQSIRRTARGITDRRGFVGTPDQEQAHQSAGRFSGFTFGSRPLLVRIYDKTAEIAHASAKTFFHDLWQEAAPGVVFGLGEHETPVWRVEAQITRDAARFFGLGRLAEALATDNLCDAWTQITQQWLSLRVPDPAHPKKRTSRLPVDPRWQTFVDAWGPGCPRRYGARIPDRDIARTARAAAGSLASFGAAIGGAEIEKALAELASHAEAQGRYDELIADRHAEQLCHLALRAPALARLIGTTLADCLHTHAPTLTLTASALAQECRTNRDLREMFEKRLVAELRKR